MPWNMFMQRRKQYTQPAHSAALPDRVEAALAGAFIYVRSNAEDGTQRVIVQPPGMKGWQYGDDETDIQARWPALDANQLRAAVRLVRDVVQARANTKQAAMRKRPTNWVNDW